MGDASLSLGGSSRHDNTVHQAESIANRPSGIAASERHEVPNCDNEPDSASGADGRNPSSSLVRSVVAAASRVIPSVTAGRKPRRSKRSENSNFDSVRNHELDMSLRLDRPESVDEAQSVDGSVKNSDGAAMPSLKAAQAPRHGVRESNSRPDSSNHSNNNDNRSPGGVLSRAKSVGSAVLGFVSDIKTKVGTLERTVSASASRSRSSVSPIPHSDSFAAAAADRSGGGPPRDRSRKSTGDLVSPRISRTSSIVSFAASSGEEEEGRWGSDELRKRFGSKGNGGSETDHDSSEQSPIEQVALIVPTTDDPSTVVWTFRTVVLGLFSCILITFLNTYFSYRTEPIMITVTTVLIATAPMGRFMASALPDRFVRIPGTQRGFSLNPGPFNMKEHGLISIFASAGSVRPGGIFVVNIVKVFFHDHIGFLPGFLVILTCEMFGFCWSVFLYKFLAEPARFWWPGSLVNVSVVRALNLDEKRKGMSLIAFFLICFCVTCAYYVIPGFFMPSVTSVSVICLIFKHNVLAQQLGSGSRGLGLGAFSLDWATISAFLGSPLVVPWAAVINILVGFVIQAYLVTPLTYWKNWFDSKNYPFFSSDIYTKNGQKYDVSRLLERSNSKFHRSKDGIREMGLPHFSAFYTMSMGFTFALFGAVTSQVLFFNGKDLLRTLRAAVTGQQPESPDVHTRMMNKYPQIPMWWSVLLLLGTHLVAIVCLVVYKDQLEMKWWGIFLSDAVTAIMVVPVSILTATTNQVPNLGIIPQYIMGFIRAGEPVTNVIFRTYTTVVCGRTGTYLSNFKFAIYLKIPPRATFIGQVIGTVVSALVSILVATWLTESIDDICDVAKLPQNTPWTCPQDKVFYDQAVLFGMAGSHRLLTKGNAPYRTLNYYFLPGFFLPVLLWLLGLAMPRREWISLINGPLIVRGAFFMPPATVVSNAMWIYLALFFSLYVFIYRKAWWRRYNYVLSAALDAGTVTMALLLYYSLDEGKKSLHWWGRKEKGDHCPLASCPTAPGIDAPGCPTF